MAIHPNAMLRAFVKDRGHYGSRKSKWEKAPEIWESGMRWVTLKVLGFPNTVLMEDGTVYKLDEFGGIKFKQAQTGRGHGKKLSVTLGMKGEKSEQYFVHVLVAWSFLSREDATAYRVGFKDGDTRNVHVDNLEWL